MGKIRIKTIGIEEVEKQEKKKAKIRAETKKQAKPEKAAKAEQVAEVLAGTEDKSEKPAKKKQKTAKTTKKVSGKKYLVSKKLVDKKKVYPLDEAVKLIKQMKYTSFDESVEVHLNLKELGIKGEVSLPHGTGKAVNVAIADDKVLDEIESGNITFDVLIASPSFMPKLVKFAKILGPKGLMPNPKNGTVSDKPEEAAKKFKTGSVRYKSEAKFPLIHQSVGKISYSEKQIEENIASFLDSVDRKNITNAFISSTMSPSVQIVVEV